MTDQELIENINNYNWYYATNYWDKTHSFHSR